MDSQLSPRSAAAPRLPYVTGVAGALLIAFSAIFVRLSGVAPSTSAVYRCVYALPALAALAWWEKRRFGPRTWRDHRLALLAGVFLAIDLIAWHHAIDAVGAGLATVLANTQIVVVGLIAWAVLGERPAPRVLVAVPVVLFGVVLISGVVGEGAYGRNPALGGVLGVVTAVSYAGFLLTLRQGNRDQRRPAGPLLEATVVAAVGSALMGTALGELQLAPSWPAHGWLLLLALTSQVLAWLLISVSLPRLPAVMTSIVLSLQPVSSVVLAMVLLDEAPSPLQLAGVVVVLVGIAAATLAGGGSKARQHRAAALQGAPTG